MGRVDSENRRSKRRGYNHRIRQFWRNETHFMLDLPENELFSAYVDGELTAAEQVEVEQILNDNPEARQLVDELRSLSLSLQSLPPYKLDKDLAERVLVQAEREMLAQPASPLPGFHQVDVAEAKPSSWFRRFLRPRSIAWSAAAIFVAIVLVFNESDTNNRGANRVAQAPGGITFEPLDIEPTVEGVEDTSIATVVPAAKPDVPAQGASDGVAAVPDPTMVAKTAPDDHGPNQEAVAGTKNETAQLLVLQCELAEGRSGHQSLAELLKEAGVAVDKPLGEEGDLVELTLTTEQVLQVVSQLRDRSGGFTGFTFLPTSTTAPPRIPSGIGPTSSHTDGVAPGKSPGTTEAPKAAVPVPGTNTIQPEVAPADSAKTRVPAKVVPLKDDSTYRVRFLLKTPEKANTRAAADH